MKDDRKFNMDGAGKTPRKGKNLSGQDSILRPLIK